MIIPLSSSILLDEVRDLKGERESLRIDIDARVAELEECRRSKEKLVKDTEAVQAEVMALKFDQSRRQQVSLDPSSHILYNCSYF